MEDEITPGRGSAKSAEWFREQLSAIGMGQSALVRLMVDLGDDRPMPTILQSLSRMASGDARVSGEMRALLGIIASARATFEAQNPGVSWTPKFGPRVPGGDTKPSASDSEQPWYIIEAQRIAAWSRKE